jgi:hypothetical protein
LGEELTLLLMPGKDPNTVTAEYGEPQKEKIRKVLKRVIKK